MTIQAFHNEKDYERAVARIDELLDAPSGTAEANELEVWSILVHDYESKVRPMEPPHPIEAIKFRMEQQGLSRKDLEPLIGSRAKVSEVLNGQRPLSKAMIRRLHAAWGISYEALMGSLGDMEPTG